ncbi:MAG TPA: MazG family protein [Nocardioides sp.]|nr:MazG family protein [Nocardioides sp.]
MTAEPLLEFLEVMRRLRAECAWKRGQTHRSLSRYLLEETYETLEAIDAGEETGDWGHLREELGDLLLQVYFHAVIAEETGEFTLDDVAADIVVKMRRRNPHVFSPSEDSPVEAADINEVWEQIKATEKQRTSVTDGLPPALPALLYADKVLDRLAREGRGGPVVEPVETAPPHDLAHDLGDRLLALVAEARASGVDPEQALRDAVRRRL